MNVTINSEPIHLGTFNTDANGSLDINVTIPSFIEPGFHTLHLYAEAPSGAPVDLYQPIEVNHSLADKDGDNIPDIQDKCLFVSPANTDTDQDTIDDACDPFIAPIPELLTLNITNPITTSNQRTVAISGTGGNLLDSETITTAHISIDDSSPTTPAVTKNINLAITSSGNGEFTTTLDVSSLADGSLTVTVRLTNEYGASSLATAATTKVTDTAAPVTTATLSPLANDAGWNKTNTFVTLNAIDEGSGVKAITHNTIGATTISPTTTPGSNASLTIAAEGVTTLNYHAADIAGNAESIKTKEVKIDKTIPVTSIASSLLPVILNSFNSQLNGTASDNLSGISLTQVTFTNIVTNAQIVRMAVCKTGCSTNGAPTSSITWEVRPTGVPVGVYNVIAQSADKAGNSSNSSAGRMVVVAGQ